jgi:membrane protein
MDQDATEQGERKSRLRRAWIVLFDALSHFNDDDGWAMASHVALSTLMAVFPFLIFVAALAGFIGNTDLAQIVADRLFAVWPAEVAAPIAEEVHRVLSVSRGGLLTVSVLITIYLASNGVEAVRTALNRAYRVTENRNFVWRRLQSVFFVLIGAVASLALGFLGVLGPLIFAKLSEWVPPLAPFQTSFTYTGYVITSLFLAVVLISGHLWLPASRPPALRLWPGIVSTLVLWLVGATAFGLYLGRFANYVATYAGLASVVTAIFFLYLVAAVMIFGAEFNAALGRLRNNQIG